MKKIASKQYPKLTQEQIYEMAIIDAYMKSVKNYYPPKEKIIIQ